jgi:dephospho-CoA kinase
VKPHHPFVVGLTGNLGSGKSTVGKISESLGARVIDADHIVRGLLVSDTGLAEEVASAFGPEVMTNGWPDRPALAETVFRDAAALSQLEKLVFPRVGQEIKAKLSKPSHAVVTVIEAIKIVEGPTCDLLDALWIVEATVQLQVDRAVSLRGMRKDDVLHRLSSQSSPDDKASQFKARWPHRAVSRINNTSTLDDLHAQVVRVWDATLASAAQRGDFL